MARPVVKQQKAREETPERTQRSRCTKRNQRIRNDESETTIGKAAEQLKPRLTNIEIGAGFQQL